MKKNALAGILGALFLSGCTTQKQIRLMPLPTPPQASARVLTAAQIPPRPRTSITLEWTCRIEGNEVTGIISATNVFGPWHQECRFALTNELNRWTDQDVTRPAKFYRAFADWETN